MFSRPLPGGLFVYSFVNLYYSFIVVVFPFVMKILPGSKVHLNTFV